MLCRIKDCINKGELKNYLVQLIQIQGQSFYVLDALKVKLQIFFFSFEYIFIKSCFFVCLFVFPIAS